MDNKWDDIRLDKEKAEKGKSKLISPEPKRLKYITELLHAFASRKITFAELTRLNPKKVRQVAEMGYVKLRHGRTDEARKIFEVLTFIDHKNYFHRLALGGAYQKLKRNVDAIYQYSEALKQDPHNLNALVNRGEIFLRNKNFRKAAEDFREAILADTIGRDRFANRARSLVIAIKRSIAREKELKTLGPVKKVEKKKISPLKLVTPLPPPRPQRSPR
ncbi:MAG: tetratricopeptide repeat protein [Deltaproteobacteria bacterium]|nr:tetratricopeptide repeat protein [Deltaproteobacteria bacterium]